MSRSKKNNSEQLTISGNFGKYYYLYRYNALINSELKNRFLKYGENRIVKLKDIPIDYDTIFSGIENMSKIIFEVTQDCNMRCKYCVYGGDYHYERKLTKHHMEPEIAKMGLELIFNTLKHRRKKELSIAFYGGEPLLRFAVIKEIIEYSKNIFKDWKLKFSMTSNGTIMTDEVLEFLSVNKVSLSISLDGPKQIHDNKRVFSGGTGTFNPVWNNIKKIAERDAAYFSEKVRFNVVLSKELQIIDAVRFFDEEELIKGNKKFFSFVSSKNNDYFKKYPYRRDEYVKNLNKILKSIENKIINGNELTHVDRYFKDNIINENNLHRNFFTSMGDACLFSKLFIDYSGRFHFCEQINNQFSYGNVRDGFNIEKMQELVKGFMAINKNICNNCEVQFLCSRCYVNFARDGVFKFDQEYCARRIKNLTDKLIEYVKYNERICKAETSETRSPEKTKKFHQFVKLEKGPVNTAIIDFLKGNIYQAENSVIKKFENRKYEEILEFVNAADQEELFINVNPDTWIPQPDQFDVLPQFLEKLRGIFSFNLEIEEGINLDDVIDIFKDFEIPQVTYYGSQKIEQLFPLSQIKYSKKDFSRCIEKCRKDGSFVKTNEEEYHSNTKYNSCWGKKIAITKDGKIRPCIYSDIIIGDINKLNDEDIEKVITDAETYWEITKDKVDKCKDCELKYTCFDCREIAYRVNRNLYDVNPYCNYDPYTGTWVGG